MKSLPMMLLAFLMVAGCGFRPVYQKNAPVPALGEELQQVEVPILTGSRLEQILTATLADALDPQAQGRLKNYRLEMAVKNLKDPAIIQQDREITRYRVQIIADYRLIDKTTGKRVFKENARIRTTYDDLASEFANYSAQVDAEERAGKELAQIIRQQLMAYFAREK